MIDKAKLIDVLKLNENSLKEESLRVEGKSRVMPELISIVESGQLDYVPSEEAKVDDGQDAIDKAHLEDSQDDDSN